MREEGRDQTNERRVERKAMKKQEDKQMGVLRDEQRGKREIQEDRCMFIMREEDQVERDQQREDRWMHRER